MYSASDCLAQARKHFNSLSVDPAVNSSTVMAMCIRLVLFWSVSMWRASSVCRGCLAVMFPSMYPKAVMLVVSHVLATVTSVAELYSAIHVKLSWLRCTLVYNAPNKEAKTRKM